MDEETLRLTASKLAKSLLFIRNSNIREGGIAAMMMVYQKKKRRCLHRQRPFYVLMRSNLTEQIQPPGYTQVGCTLKDLASSASVAAFFETFSVLGSSVEIRQISAPSPDSFSAK